MLDMKGNGAVVTASSNGGKSRQRLLCKAPGVGAKGTVVWATVRRLAQPVLAAGTRPCVPIEVRSCDRPRPPSIDRGRRLPPRHRHARQTPARYVSRAATDPATCPAGEADIAIDEEAHEDIDTCGLNCARYRSDPPLEWSTPNTVRSHRRCVYAPADQIFIPVVRVSHSDGKLTERRDVDRRSR